MDSSGLSHLSADDNKLRPFRIMALTIAIAIPLVRFLLPADAYDPMWQRLLLSGIFMMAGIGSWVSKRVRKFFYYINYALIFLTNIWMLELSFLNGLRLEYITTFFVILVCSGLVFRHSRYIFAFMIGLFVFSLFLNPLVVDPVISIYYFYILEGVAMVTITLALEMLVSERKSMHEANENYRLITKISFENAEQGILILDKEGRTVLYNPTYPRLWGLDESDLVIGEKWAAGPKIKPLVQDKDAWSAVIKEAFEEPEKEIRQTIQLIDGRVYERSTRALFQNEKNLGRIWFTRDVTILHRVQEEKEKVRKRMSMQNQALLSLASSPDIKEGRLDAVLEQILDLAEQALDVWGAAIWLKSENGETLELNRSRNWEHTSKELSLNDHISYQSILGDSRVISWSQTEGSPSPLLELFPDLVKGACLDVPIRIGGEVSGLLMMHCPNRTNPWTEIEKSFAASMGDVVTLAAEANQRKRVEEQLGESVAVLRSVFEMSGVGIVVTAYDGRILDFNSLYREIWGITDKMLNTKSQQEIIEYARNLLKDEEKSQKAVQFLSDNPDQNRYDLLHFKDGKIVERYTGVLEVDGAVMGRIWYFRDLTRQFKADEDLRTSEQRNRALLDAIPDVMLLLGQEGEVLSSKVSEMPEYLGFQPEVGQHFREFFSEELIDLVSAGLDRVLEERTLVELESEVSFLGRTCDMEVRLTMNDAGEVLLMLRDVTQRKTIERELIQRNFELDSFVYRASHDLKAPLNSLMGLIDILKTGELNESQKQYMVLMDRSVVKLDTFIRNLTDFSRITRTEVEYQELDFQEMLDEIQESLQYMEEAERVRVTLNVEGESKVFGDRFHMGIVLSNLVSNAFKYQDFEKKESLVEVNVSIGRDSLVVEVKDNGIGIPAEHQNRLFELFFRASNQSFGSGLGLYITQNAVGKMGGAIDFKSVEGEGTSFTFRLPNQVQAISS